MFVKIRCLLEMNGVFTHACNIILNVILHMHRYKLLDSYLLHQNPLNKALLNVCACLSEHYILKFSFPKFLKTIDQVLIQ